MSSVVKGKMAKPPSVPRTSVGWFQLFLNATKTGGLKSAAIIILFASMQRQASVARSVDHLTVASDGSGDFKTVQAAVDSVSVHNDHRITIRIKPGTYRERIDVPKGKDFITFLGDDGSAETTILVDNLSAKSVVDGKAVGTRNSSSVSVEASDFAAKEITFQNDAGDIGQAVAFRTGSERCCFDRCRFLGWQDTLYPNEGRAHFRECYIEGRTDFIFGKATCVFENCTLHSKNGGYFTAAATPAEHLFGFVFINCDLSGDGAAALLGRPWRPSAAVAFIRCKIRGPIAAEGWDNWGNAANEKTARFAEYQCTGDGAKRDHRVVWSRELSDAEAATYSARNVLAGSDGWDATPLSSAAEIRPTTAPTTVPTTAQ